MGAGTKSNANILQLTTANNYTIKQDTNGFLGIYNTSGTEVAFFDGHGAITFLGAEAASNPTASVVIGFESNNNFMVCVPAGNYGFDFYNGGNRVAKIGQNGFFIVYGSQTVSGNGMLYPVASVRQKSETTTADSTLLVYTPPATKGTYWAKVTASVSSATAGVVSFTIVFTDSNGSTISATAIPLTQLGTALPANSFTTASAGEYSGTLSFDIDSSASNVTIAWVGGGVIAAKVSAEIFNSQ